MSTCADCENKARAKNEIMDALRSIVYDEPVAIVEIDGELSVMPVHIAVLYPIKEVIIPEK